MIKGIFSKRKTHDLSLACCVCTVGIKIGDFVETTDGKRSRLIRHVSCVRRI